MLRSPEAPDASPEHTALITLIDELRTPAFVVSAKGTVLYANRLAQLSYHGTPEWVSQACRESPQPWCKRIRVCAGSEAAYVCIPHDPVQVERLGLWVAEQWALPPRLALTAAKIIAGLSDRELAESMGITCSTARTYVRNVFKHVGIKGRSALIAEAIRVLHQ